MTWDDIFSRIEFVEYTIHTHQMWRSNFLWMKNPRDMYLLESTLFVLNCVHFNIIINVIGTHVLIIHCHSIRTYVVLPSLLTFLHTLLLESIVLFRDSYRTFELILAPYGFLLLWSLYLHFPYRIMSNRFLLW